MRIGDEINIIKKWEVKLHQALVGATIVEARYTTEAEQEAMGWYEKGAILILKKKGDPDPYYIFPHADDEGNNAGALAFGCFNPNIEVKEDLFPVI